ncbi:LOW QUALITY PROTEIN: hypothetical protein M514_04418 [Trichuris suis]|uniref:SCAN domain-containing protein 3 n=1 Tax=Trichuris suis TaxID=68888 RepID=A0A085MBX2_9BILA|nr:LOW QUALITY PROTEIN: hypothetical protein M513_04418 [Trichuris suis]KFD62506.1 LOW QUALITY PROTEIN: hypothetical protein M514_04418 [Trichuris suis]
MSYFQSLRDSKQQLRSMLSSTSGVEDDGLRASYNISLLIAKSGKAHTIGEELLLPVVSEVLDTVLHRQSADAILKIPLSNDTVQCRIDEMAKDVEDALCSIPKKTQFSLQLDESTLPGNEIVLLACVRFIKEEKFVQELVKDTKGESTFLILKDFFVEKEIPLTNIMSLKHVAPDILVIHCVIHRQRLVVKRLSARLNSSLRLFRQLCEQNDEEYNRLLLHTEVRWLSKGDCLSSFYSLFETVLEFFEKHDVSLGKNVKEFQSDIAYLCELYSKFNEMNLLLQGDDLNLIRTKAVVCAFQIFEKWKEGGKFMMNTLKNIAITWSYCTGTSKKDITSMEIPDWVLNPFSAAGNGELLVNEDPKVKYKNGYQAFLLQTIVPDLYPGLRAVVRQLLVAFRSSYLAERGLSVVTDLSRKNRNRLRITKRGDLRLRLTSMQPNVDKLVSLR